MKTALRLLVLSVTLGLVLTVAGTAAGKPSCPGHPSCKDEPAPQTYDVTMSFVEGSGLATTCSASGDPQANGSLLMSGNPTSSLEAANGFLEMQVTIPWERHYDAGWGTGDGTLHGCHGLSESAATTDSFPGKIWLSFGQGTVDLEWRFDYFWDFRYETRGHKQRKVQEVLEILELTGSGLSWTPTQENGTLTGTVSGEVSLSLFTKDVDGITEFWTPIGEPSPLSFTLSITPTG